VTMVTLNPTKWQLPSLLSIARAVFSVALLFIFGIGVSALLQGAFVIQTAFMLLLPVAWFGLMFRDRVGGLL